MCIKNRIVLALFILLTSASGWSYNNGPASFQVPQGPPTDLMQETQSLNLQVEPSVQKKNHTSDGFITVLAGFTHPNFLSIESHGNTVNYGFSNSVPLLSAQFMHFPWMARWGKLGWEASVGYSYSEYQGSAQPTALHLLPANVSLVYRYENSSTRKFIPYAGIGPSLWTYFQRGVDEYNSSGAVWLASATAGIAFNLNRLGLVDSRNETEIVLQYQRQISARNGAYDFNGDTLQIGGTLAL